MDGEVCHFASACHLNDPEFPDSCPPLLLPVPINVAQVLVDRPNVSVGERLGVEEIPAFSRI